MMKIRSLLCTALLILLLPLTHALAGPRPAFTWDNAIVYFVMTDRFYNGNPANDHSYGRQPDGDREIGTWHGGDLKGLTIKLNQGYFDRLGINAIWITAPYQQILGWVVGGDKAFKHYGYHGYYALDYTILDANMGTDAELQEFVDTAHKHGIRVIFDVVMNHPGYGDAVTLSKYGVNVLWPGWEKASVKDYYSYFNFNSENWVNWWGPDWVRTDLPGYESGGWDDLTKQIAYLPDFKTESTKVVGLPPFYAHKKDTRAVAIKGFTVRQYLIKWLTDWVRNYGIDGFRCDTAKHVELPAWAALKKAAEQALRDWKHQHPEKKLDDLDFWMTGENWGQDVERNAYFDNGFDSMINFEFQKQARYPEKMEEVFSSYASKINSDPSFNVLSYISSHDTHLFDRDRLFEAATYLMLLPGGIQIFYGDESARENGPRARGDYAQQTRSDMNWKSINQPLLHWQKLGQFRNRHPAMAAGSHKKLADAPYTFVRELDRNGLKDKVLVQLGDKLASQILVAGEFPDGALLHDAYNDDSAKVANGKVSFKPSSTHVRLIEQLLEKN